MTENLMQKIEANSPEAKSADLMADNLAKLRALFPELLTEGPNGVAVNVDVLKALVGDQTATDAEEKYGLNWHGKRRARQLALTPSTGTLRPCPNESVDWDTTKNLMIEGDNLEVLKLLQKSYAGKVKLIYIDPPYNTGKDFVYPDNFQDSIKNYFELTGQIEGGAKVSSNTEAGGRFHTDWLSMLYPRLKIARDLLEEHGVILCSIDDIESPRLRLLLDEVFGEENFLAQFVWKSDGNFDNQAKIKICHEYILLYAKSVDAFPHPPVVDPSTPKDSKLFRPEIKNTIVKNGPKNPISTITLPVGFPSEIESGEINARTTPWPRYKNTATIKDGKLVNTVIVESGWSSKDLALEFILNECQPIEDGKGQSTAFVISKSGAIEIIKKRTDYQSHVISVLSGFGGTQKATAQLDEIGAFFNGYPKPVDLIRYLVKMAAGNDGIFMDFFAGSGPLGHAIYEQNASDEGSRRFILIQLPETLNVNSEVQKAAAEYCDKIAKPRTVSELTKERLRRAGKRVRSTDGSPARDTGFRSFRLDTSNIRAWNPNPADLDQTLFKHQDHLTDDRTEADVLYELLLKRGLDLCVPISSRIVNGKEVHAVGGGVLLACLATSIAATEVEAVAMGIVNWYRELAPAGDTTCVFLDSAFADDVAKTNMAAILEQNGIQNVRSL
jgi:adenine-specific DNA-methyltransferase